MNEPGNAVPSGSAEKTVQDNESLENGVAKKNVKNNVKGRKRKKYLRDKTAPRPPHSGYIRYLNDRREQFRAENPNLPLAEITKILAAEWSQLPADRKQQYLLAAEQERVKYIEELAAYKKTDAYQNFAERNLKKTKVNIPTDEPQEVKKETPPSDNSNAPCDIPIFSEDFINFNKARDSELRYLRKTVIDQEQEVSVLDKHIENMNNGIIKLMANTKQLEVGCLKYEQHLNKLRSKCLVAFANMKLPDNTEPPTIQTVDNYIINLATLLKTGSYPSLISNVKKVVSNLDFSQL